MARRVRIKWRLKGFEEIRRLPRVKERLHREALSIAFDAGDGYEAFVDEGKTRSRASVVTTGFVAMLDNNRHNTLNRILASRRKNV